MRAVSAEGRVSEWHAVDGWGVIEALETPGGCWTHYSAILIQGYAELHAGDVVDFTYERADQDGYRFRAVDVWPPGADKSTAARSAPMSDPGGAFRSTLTVRLDDGQVSSGDAAYELIRPRPDEAPA